MSIHFRCSDVLGSTNGAYGYLNFNVYEKLIPVDTRLLYILSDHPDRSKERGQSALCGKLVEHLAAHLRAVLPLALVVPLRGGTMSIHSDIPAIFISYGNLHHIVFGGCANGVCLCMYKIYVVQAIWCCR